MKRRIVSALAIAVLLAAGIAGVFGYAGNGGATAGVRIHDILVTG